MRRSVARNGREMERRETNIEVFPLKHSVDKRQRVGGHRRTHSVAEEGEEKARMRVRAEKL